MRSKKSVSNANTPKKTTAADKDAGATEASIVVSLAERAAGEIIEITELTPDSGAFIGKHINPDGSLTEYPDVMWWRQHVEHVPATVSHLFAYLREARGRNICLIRGAPANLERRSTRRQKAGIYGSEDRGDHGFIDTPTKLFFLDIDGTPMAWRDDPEGAIRRIVAQLGEPWCSTSFVWFFSAKHGLARDKRGRWKGKISDDSVRAHLAFITSRALNEAEACALTKVAMVQIPKIDFRISLCVQPNYIKRPHWKEHPDRDPLGDIPTIGWVKGESEYLAIPDNLEHKARWAKAQGLTANIAEHPDATTAVRSIGSDGSLRPHLMSAVIHLLNANPIPEVVSFVDHSITVVNRLRILVEQHSEEIDLNLKANKRKWVEVEKHLSQMPAWAEWALNHPGALRRKSIKLIKEEKPERQAEVTLEAICARVLNRMARTALRAHKAAKPESDEKLQYTELITAPTGSWKSTLMRRVAVMYVRAHPDKTVVILMPRHQLGKEQLDLLAEEHPDGNYTAAVWRGRQAWDPDIGDGFEERMCRRADEAKSVEDNMLDVERHLCKQGRGKKAVKCPFFDVCAYQRQKRTEANIIFAAHEVMVHKKPKAFGDIGLILIDESPLDAFMFGVDSNALVELPLDKLRDSVAGDECLTAARNALYQVFDKTPKHAGVNRQALHNKKFTFEYTLEEVEGRDEKPTGKVFNVKQTRSFEPKIHHRQEWKRKVKSGVRPNMTKARVLKELEKTAGNAEVKARATLWKLVAKAIGTFRYRIQGQPVPAQPFGGIQIRDSKVGRVVSMVGLHEIAKGWSAPALICDATGDAELLRAIWPALKIEDEPWPQLPRPASVRVFQVVDRSFSKWGIAVEGKNKKELERKAGAAGRVYAAVLLKALEYGGAEVAVIVYKSTEEWIRANCFVPEWLKLKHHGDVAGTNILQDVRAIFEVGRMQPPPEAMARQAEALFGEHIAKREYSKIKGARIPIMPDEDGNNIIGVELFTHRNPIVRRLLWQAREGSCIQAEGRARAGRRDDASPLDIWRYHDVPVPELGPVEPVLWEEVEVGLDGLMLATGGVWLECIADATKAYPDLLKVDALKYDRKTRGVGSLLIGSLISKLPTPRLIHYQRRAKGARVFRGFTLLPPAETRAWLEGRLGSLARFDMVPPASSKIA